MSSLNQLVGKTIEEVRLDAEKTTIEFVTDFGSEFYYTEGDCCSSSWIEHISGLSELLGKKVLNTVDLEMESFEEPCYDGISCYGYQLNTETGRCIIEMRNHSNGYYGGWMEHLKGHSQLPNICKEDF